VLDVAQKQIDLGHQVFKCHTCLLLFSALAERRCFILILMTAMDIWAYCAA
jgi:hypothetical protein